MSEIQSDRECKHIVVGRGPLYSRYSVSSQSRFNSACHDRCCEVGGPHKYRAGRNLSDGTGTPTSGGSDERRSNEPRCGIPCNNGTGIVTARFAPSMAAAATDDEAVIMADRLVAAFNAVCRCSGAGFFRYPLFGPTHPTPCQNVSWRKLSVHLKPKFYRCDVHLGIALVHREKFGDAQRHRCGLVGVSQARAWAPILVPFAACHGISVWKLQ